MPARRPFDRSWLAGLVAAAAGFGASAAGHAEDGFHPLNSALTFMNLKADGGTMPDFVQASRPTAPAKDYIPVGRVPATRALKAKTPAEIKAEMAELDAARAAQLAGRRPKPAGAAPPVGKQVQTLPRRAAATDH